MTEKDQKIKPLQRKSTQNIKFEKSKPPPDYQTGAQSKKKKPFQEENSQEFFELLKENNVLKCLNMLKKNRNLVNDCDDERRTALHVACSLDFANMVQILLDFGSKSNAKDDYGRKPIDEALSTAQIKGVGNDSPIIQMIEEDMQG